LDYWVHTAVTLDDVLFRVDSAHLPNQRTRNSGCMMPFEAGNDQTDAFGILQRIMEHELYPGGPTLVFCEVEWLTRIGALFEDRFPLAKRNPRDAWNLDRTGYRFDVIARFHPQNIVYLPLDGDDWDMEGDLACLYRRARDRMDRTARD
jgi:hypothetical protein